MIIEPRALCRFVICCWCRNRGVDGAIPAVEDKRTNNGNDDLGDVFIDNPYIETKYERINQVKLEEITESKFERDFRELVKGYIHNGEWVDMSTPRRCSYNQHRYHHEVKKVPRGLTIPTKKTSNGALFRPMSVEMRGITLCQLRAIYANAARRCIEEKWIDSEGEPVTPDTVNLFAIDRYITKPFTEASQASVVETLPSTAGTQPPMFFISHFWGTPLKDTIACVEQMNQDFKWNYNDKDEARGGGMTVDTPLWICAFANNFWNETISANPLDSPYIRAMEFTNFRSLIIIDSELRIFTRIWPIMEIYLTVISDRGVLVVYTAHEHSVECYREDRSAVGIVTGGATGESAEDTSYREEHFPMDIILSLADIKVENSQSSVDSDRIEMLNYITDNKYRLNTNTSISHPNYDKLNQELNHAIRGIFKLNCAALRPPLSSKQAYELISSIPVTCKGLILTNADDETTIGAIRGLGEWVGKANEVKEIIFLNCRVGDSDKGQMIGSQLVNWLTNAKCTETIEHFYIMNSDLVVPGNISDLASLVFKKMKNMKLFYVTDESNRTLTTLSKGRHTHAFKVDFSAYDQHPLSSQQACALLSQIPITCTHLYLGNAVDSETTIGAVRGMVEWLRNAREVRELILDNCNVGDGEDGRAIGSELANEFIECSATSAIEYFHIKNTDLVVSGDTSEWASALRQMKNLFEFKCLGGSRLSDDDVNILSNAAFESGAFACFKTNE